MYVPGGFAFTFPMIFDQFAAPVMHLAYFAFRWDTGMDHAAQQVRIRHLENACGHFTYCMIYQLQRQSP
jgi:hypothetical protein